MSPTVYERQMSLSRAIVRLAIDDVEARLTQLDARLEEIAAQKPYREPVGWLRCFRGHRHANGHADSCGAA
jgi:hypothetical protein